MDMWFPLKNVHNFKRTQFDVNALWGNHGGVWVIEMVGVVVRLSGDSGK